MHLVVDGIIYSLQSRGGISRAFTELLPRVCDRSPDIHVTLLTHGRLRQVIPTHERIHEQRLFQIDSYLRPTALWEPCSTMLKRHLIRRSVEAPANAVWHSTYFTQPLSWPGPTVTTVYDMIHERFPDLFTTSTDQRFRDHKRRAIAASDVLACISLATADDLRRFYGDSLGRIEVIPLACSDLFTPLRGCAPRTPLTLLYVGARYHYKNFWEFLESLETWKHRGECEVAVVGPPWSPAEKVRLQAMPRLPPVRNLGQVSDENLCRLYNDAAAFVYPSLYEGFGIPLLEAMACRCPVVASDIPSTREIAADAPFYFNLGDRESFHAALSMAVHTGRESAPVRKGIARAATFTWERVAEGYVDLYRSINA